eukprot:TRINITY_DN7299_c0_g1_i4.p1 TRINITY_DN7299_c0_g1~~TRINITY_DN7299_c0_g1_i4.p1  ORF type:complete len:219 (-),score=24.22 TRINITY_DN7299_c0_g1_i4:94-750(-)
MGMRTTGACTYRCEGQQLVLAGDFNTQHPSGSDGPPCLLGTGPLRKGGRVWETERPGGVNEYTVYDEQIYRPEHCQEITTEAAVQLHISQRLDRFQRLPIDPMLQRIPEEHRQQRWGLPDLLLVAEEFGANSGENWVHTRVQTGVFSDARCNEGCRALEEQFQLEQDRRQDESDATSELARQGSKGRGHEQRLARQGSNRGERQRSKSRNPELRTIDF